MGMARAMRKLDARTSHLVWAALIAHWAGAVRQAVAHREAVARERDRRFHEPLPRQRSLLRPREMQSGDGAGHADGAMSSVVSRAAMSSTA